MAFSRKSLVIFTFVNTLSLGLMLSVNLTPGIARTAQNRPIQRNSGQSQIQDNTNFGVSPNFKGNWEGRVYPKGDDTSTVLEISVSSKSGSNYQGTWKHHGAKYNPQSDSYEDTILQQGILKASRTGNEVTMELNGYHQNKLLLKGTLTPSQISGEVVGNSHFLFFFDKQ